MTGLAAVDLDAALDAALARRPEASALACVDVHSGMVLASAARDAAALWMISAGTATSTALAGMPALDDEEDEPGAEPPVDRSLVMSREWVQVHERVPGCGSIFVVGVAAAGANVGLLASCVRDVSSLLGSTE